jgi:hypothetical protein
MSDGILFPNGQWVHMSNGSMITLLYGWKHIALNVVCAKNDVEVAVAEWLSERVSWASDGQRGCLAPHFRSPLEAPFASFQSVAYFRRIVEVMAHGLQKCDAPYRTTMPEEKACSLENVRWTDYLNPIHDQLQWMLDNPEGLFGQPLPVGR